MIANPDLSAAIMVLLASLLVHELGHSFAAQALGLRVKEIVITPLGGMASIEGLSRQPLNEAKVAASGPLANLVIAGLCALIDHEMAYLVMIINLGIGLGNLIPIFPLDGGRILRGIFSAATNPVDAANGIGKISNYLCLVLILFGFKYGFLLYAIAISLYCFFSHKKELLSQVFATGTPPSLGFDEIMKRTFTFFVHGNPSQPKQPADHDESLENFGGSLEEYFEDKQ
jgi:Zn-dependent protease|tara:strand:+ start:545 stop:1231 length:687 start_codon:yes stop_codon:yes gene_type:complete